MEKDLGNEWKTNETQTLQKEKHLWKKNSSCSISSFIRNINFFLLQEKETVIVPENTITTIDSSKIRFQPESANGLVNTP